MEDFWKRNEVKEYVLTEIFDVDEVVRKYGGCPDDEEYIILRRYLNWEWQGNEEWKMVEVSKEDFEKHSGNEGSHYITELNYEEFEDKFWFEEFENFISGKILIFSSNDFLSAVNKIFYESKFEGQAKYFLREVIESLEYACRQLKRISQWKKETHDIAINKIQKFVIDQYMGSYNETIQYIIDDYKFIFPEIENYKNQYILFSNKRKNIYPVNEYKKIWQKLGILIATSVIQFVKVNQLGGGINIKYNDEEFESGNSLAKRLGEIWEMKPQSLKPYINDTLNNEMRGSRKNIFNSFERADFFLSYCAERKIKPSEYLLEKWENLKKDN